MEIYVNGKKIYLTQKNFVAKGGEAQIFKKNKTAFKIYNDLTKVIPTGKINELKSVSSPQILGPRDLILNSKRENIGFTMDWLGNNVIPLCKLFTNSFRKSNQIQNEQIILLVENIKNLISFIHNHNCLIVDGNELNYLVKNDFITPYMIDINSWQTPSYKATAIMPSIRDWTTNLFTILTDWFSFGIVVFQLFVGIHPYKGRHPKYKKNDLISRIKDCVSVFNTNVTVPPTTRDFSLIPSNYKDWFYKVFEKGERILPPSKPGSVSKSEVIVQIIQSTKMFDITTILEVDDDILFYNPQHNIIKTKNYLFINRTKYQIELKSEVLFTILEKIPIVITIKNNQSYFKTLQSGYNVKEFKISCTDLMIVNDHLYLKYKSLLFELDFKVFGNTVVTSIKTTWFIEPLSSILFSNVIYQNVLGKSYLCIPIPNNSGRSSFYIKAIPELDKYRIIEAKYQNHVCMLIGHDGTQYNKIIIVFDDLLNSYVIRIIENINYTSLNFVVLDNGVCVTIEDNFIEIFLNKINKPNIKRIEDPKIDGTMNLCKDGTSLMFYKKNKVYRIKLKK